MFVAVKAERSDTAHCTWAGSTPSMVDQPIMGLRHVDPLLGNDREISNYKTACAK
jgi:hypothetical protein